MGVGGVEGVGEVVGDVQVGGVGEVGRVWGGGGVGGNVTAIVVAAASDWGGTILLGWDSGWLRSSREVGAEGVESHSGCR